MSRRSNILLALAVIAVAAGVAGLVVLEQSRERQASEAEDLLSTGVRLFEEKQYEEALGVLERVPPGSPQEARAWYYRGSVYMMQEDYETAAHFLEHSLALDNRNTGTLYALGVAWYKLGKLKLARSYFAAVLEIDPNDEHAKGLMDIMTNLDRESAGSSEPSTGTAVAEDD